MKLHIFLNNAPLWPLEAMAFAKPNIYHEHFLAALAHYAGKKMHMFEAREVSNALWSFTIFRTGQGLQGLLPVTSWCSSG